MSITTDITEEEWDKPMTCPIDPKELESCEACQSVTEKLGSLVLHTLHVAF